MQRFVEWLNRNPWLNLAFLALAFTSIITSIVLYLKSKKEKRPFFQCRTFRLVEDSLAKMEAVEILYKGQPVQNLSLTKVAVWNGGTETINSSDIAPTDVLRLCVQSPVKLLGSEIVHTTNP